MLKDGPIKRDIDRSAEFRIKTAGLKLSSKKIGSREFVAAALYEIASEHHSAIGLLLRFRRFSSAQALIRSCVETSLRVVWVLRCATEEQVDAINNKTAKWPDLEQVIGNIEGAHKRGGFIRKLLPSRGLLNELTHSGFALIADRLLPVVANMNPQVVNHESMQEHTAAFCIRTADRMLLLACAVMHIDLGDPSAADALSLAYQETAKSYEAGRFPRATVG
jgi:hypothetical protein